MNFVAKALAATAITAGLMGPALAQTDELNFGIISTESSQNLKTVWNPFLADMQKGTGLKVNAFFASDYAGVIEGMRFGKVQAAWFGNKSAMEAVDRSGGQIFAQTVDVEGNPGYWSVLLTQADNDKINSLDDVMTCDKSLDFGLGDPNSTSGFLVPTTFIFAENGVTPQDCFKTVRNASHEANALAVANGQVDVATNNTENLRRLEVTNPEARKKVKVIWQSPLIPSDPLVWKKDISDELKQKIYYFIMTYGRIGTPEEITHAREVLKGLGWAPFKPSSDAQLYPIRIMEITKQMSKIQADETMSDEEKKAELDKLQAQKKDVQQMMESVPQAS